MSGSEPRWHDAEEGESPVEGPPVARPNVPLLPELQGGADLQARPLQVQ